VTPNQVVTYTITVHNTGTATYPGATWTDDLTGVLDDATYNSDLATTGSASTAAYTAPTISWTGDVAPGSDITTTYTVTVLIAATIGADGVLTNTVNSTQLHTCDPTCSSSISVAAVTHLSFTGVATASQLLLAYLLMLLGGVLMFATRRRRKTWCVSAGTVCPRCLRSISTTRTRCSTCSTARS
jgi:hypothetical protein